MFGASVQVEVRKPLFRKPFPKGHSIDEVALRFAYAKIRFPSRPLGDPGNLPRPLDGEISFEKRKILGEAKATGLLYDAMAVMEIARDLSSAEELGLITYVDSEGNEFPSISKHPFIVLTASGNKLKAFRDELIAANIPFTCFLDTMIEGGWDAQLATTKSKKFDELTVMAIAAYGEREALDPLTKKFSLYR